MISLFFDSDNSYYQVHPSKVDLIIKYGLRELVRLALSLYKPNEISFEVEISPQITRWRAKGPITCMLDPINFLFSERFLLFNYVYTYFAFGNGGTRRYVDGLNLNWLSYLSVRREVTFERRLYVQSCVESKYRSLITMYAFQSQT